MFLKKNFWIKGSVQINFCHILPKIPSKVFEQIYVLTYTTFAFSLLGQVTSTLGASFLACDRGVWIQQTQTTLDFLAHTPPTKQCSNHL
jgi:hypothetical protein